MVERGHTQSPDLRRSHEAPFPTRLSSMTKACEPRLTRRTTIPAASRPEIGELLERLRRLRAELRGRDSLCRSAGALPAPIFGD